MLLCALFGPNDMTGWPTCLSTFRPANLPTSVFSSCVMLFSPTLPTPALSWKAKWGLFQSLVHCCILLNPKQNPNLFNIHTALTEHRESSCFISASQSISRVQLSVLYCPKKLYNSSNHTRLCFIQSNQEKSLETAFTILHQSHLLQPSDRHQHSYNVQFDSKAKNVTHTMFKKALEQRFHFV